MLTNSKNHLFWVCTAAVLSKMYEVRMENEKVSNFVVHPYVQISCLEAKTQLYPFLTSYIASFSTAHTTHDLLLIYGPVPSLAVPDTRWNWSSPTHFELHLKIEPLAISKWLLTVELKYNFTQFPPLSTFSFQTIL